MKLNRKKVLGLIEPIKIVKITEILEHDNADKLQIVKINPGEGIYDYADEDGNVQIVTAATNISEGDFVPWLAPGHVVSGWVFREGEEIRLESRKMRGEISHGMILAEDEIGLGEDHDGILKIIDLGIDISDNDLGKSLLEVLTDEQKEAIFKNAGLAEITPEVREKVELIKSIGNPENGGEIVGEEELIDILTSGEELFTYDGFEPSGQMHIAQGIIRAINTNKMIKAGFTFRMWVADWFGYLNNKMGGDLEKIKTVGEYFIEIWRAAGMNLDKTEFLWTSDEVKDVKYWELVMKVAKHTNLKRILRTTEIMGRGEADELSAGQILYPAMQITDIFQVMKCQVTQLGLDQRKVNILAREIGEDLGFWKPVIVSHGMLQGLGKPLPKDADAAERAISMKMSKSKPDTAIFMTDSEEDVSRKIKQAYCPEGIVEDNPVLDYCKQIIFESNHLERENPLLENGKFVIEREEKYGGKVEYSTYLELEETYKNKELFPLDLKNAVVKYLNSLLQPVRDHFQNDPKAKDLLEKVRNYQITR